MDAISLLSGSDYVILCYSSAGWCGGCQADAKKELAPFDDFILEQTVAPTGVAFTL